jgi:hypothetical protein
MMNIASGQHGVALQVAISVGQLEVTQPWQAEWSNKQVVMQLLMAQFQRLVHGVAAAAQALALQLGSQPCMQPVSGQLVRHCVVQLRISPQVDWVARSGGLTGPSGLGPMSTLGLPSTRLLSTRLLSTRLPSTGLPSTLDRSNLVPSTRLPSNLPMSRPVVGSPRLRSLPTARSGLTPGLLSVQATSKEQSTTIKVGPKRMVHLLSASLCCEHCRQDQPRTAMTVITVEMRREGSAARPKPYSTRYFQWEVMNSSVSGRPPCRIR